MITHVGTNIYPKNETREMIGDFEILADHEIWSEE